MKRHRSQFRSSVGDAIMRPNRMSTRSHSWLRGFARDEDGAVIVFSFFILIMMLVAGGIAIDISRQEMERARLQNTLDNAVLAAAGAPFGADPKAIVEDYFAKAQMTDYLHEIDDDGEGEDDIVTTLNSSMVKASASKEMNTHLMHLSGVKTLTATAASVAVRRVPKLEVAMVLDVSGSMGSNRKLTNLKAAAKTFVTTILNSSEHGDSVISVVPFSWNVAPGEGIYEALTVNETHHYSTCLRFDENDYNSASIDPDATYDQQIYTSLYGSFDNLTASWRSCFTEDRAEITPYSISESNLHTKIDSLHADGNTSGHLGMKWGAALLDPKFHSVATSLRGAELIDDELTDIPASYTEAETLKVIVMMGDGQNTTSYLFNDNSSYRGPNSDLVQVKWQQMEFKYAYHIYKHKTSYSENKCSKKNWECVYEASGPEQSAEFLHDVHDDRYWNIQEGEWISEYAFNRLDETLEGFISSEALDWEEAWGRMSPEYYGDITGDWGPWNDYRNSNSENGSDKDGMMDDICTATKNKGVVVYTIGFEISRGGTAETELKDCASSAAHYYRAEGVNINDAFNSIASNVVNLRLTQ
ncbi:TadE/TadG family type IV pilus assembly protein [Roseovarius pelagicus]|uniref:Tad domain-containing protein n=1 Tax=Roseovarius pelagicus TaxID=2980108 RepID=A0ABY6DA85_9RHOB|nr:TadE/TadG family type IV pilus assembly protein [Roseovarius pelagicus]UXX82894.1 Tad domain-containing protein [Roseovarius pelagicus]